MPDNPAASPGRWVRCENHFTAAPTALYGVVLLLASIAYLILQETIIWAQGNDSLLRKAVGRDRKGKLSTLVYVVAIVAAFRATWIAQGIFVAAALIWLVPDRRIKRVLQNIATQNVTNGQPTLSKGIQEAVGSESFGHDERWEL